MPVLTVNGRRVTVDPDATILDAARTAGVEVPTLCQFDGLEPWGCRHLSLEVCADTLRPPAGSKPSTKKSSW